MYRRATEILWAGSDNLLHNIPGLLGLVVAIGVLLLAGALTSSDRTPVLMTVRGWALATALSIALPLVGIRSLTAVVVLMLAMALAGLRSLRKRSIDTRGLVACIVLGAPLVLLSVSVPSIYWDTYKHWLPNAQYLFQLDQLIAAPLPPGFYSMHPTYPPALLIPVYLASRIIGGFAFGASQALCSVMVVLTSQLIFIQFEKTENRSPSSASTWQMVLVAFLALVLLNPAVQDLRYKPAVQGLHYWSFLADPTLAVISMIMMLVIAGVISNESTSGGHDSSSSNLARAATVLSLGFLAATLKQSGGVFVAVTIVATLIVGALARQDWKRLAATLTFLGAGAVAATAVWRLYQAQFQPISDQFSFASTSQWRIDLLPTLLNAIWLRVAESNFLFYGCVLAAVVLGLYALLVRHRRSMTDLDVLLAVSGLAFLGHATSLVIAYLGAGFLDWEIQRASSWQRYASQGGLAACAAVVLVILLRVGPVRRTLDTLTNGSLVKLAAVTALAYLPALWSAAGYLSYYQLKREESRRLAVAALQHIPTHSRVAVVGEDWSVNFALYSGWADFHPGVRPWVVTSYAVDRWSRVPQAKASVSSWLRDPSIDCILLLDATDFTQFVGLPKRSDQYWCRAVGGWRALDLGRRKVHKYNFLPMPSTLDKLRQPHPST